MKEYDFTGYLLEKENLYKCPFLLSWFLGEYSEIKKMPIKPSREGIAPDDPKPFPRDKAMWALYRAVSPKTSLKKFSQAYEVSYASLKIWNIKQNVKDRINELSDEFSRRFVKKFCEIIENPDLMYPPEPEKIPVDDYGLKKLGLKTGVEYSSGFIGLTPLRRLLTELKYYPKEIKSRLWFEIWLLFREKVMLYDYRLATMLFNQYLHTSKAGKISRKDFLKNRQRYYENETEILSFLFDELTKSIKKGDSENALSIASYLKHFFIESLMTEYNEYALARDLKEFNK